MIGRPIRCRSPRRCGTPFRGRPTRSARLPLNENGIDLTGNNNNWWFGLSIMHTLFVHEHNAVCDELSKHYPAWKDDQLFHTARLVIAALLAKIHTVEWTPSLLNTKLLRFGMRANWFGILGERFRRNIGRVSRGDILSGITGSETDHHGVPYAMTEEFVAVYRMHPLIPDEFDIRNARTGARLASCDLPEVAGSNTKAAIDAVGMENALYHLGTAHPGALVLRNYPNMLRKLTTEPVKKFQVDLAALDIFRDRERGVPRYNAFRRLIDMPRIERFEDLTADKELAKEIEPTKDGGQDGKKGRGWGGIEEFLKKKKLHCKDQMHMMLQKYRKQLESES